ncbi:hypothetical protein ATS75_03520 [Pseudoalteromonas sp. H105]|nr:hypothetical protein ATS75_03520 [Pseudoalteromonas sp. H105]
MNADCTQSNLTANLNKLSGMLFYAVDLSFKNNLLSTAYSHVRQGYRFFNLTESLFIMHHQNVRYLFWTKIALLLFYMLPPFLEVLKWQLNLLTC